jgi:hypothetical protein
LAVPAEGGNSPVRIELKNKKKYISENDGKWTFFEIKSHSSLN